MMEKLTKEQIDAKLAKLRESRLDDETYTVVRPAMAMCYSMEFPRRITEERVYLLKRERTLRHNFALPAWTHNFAAIVPIVYKNTAQRPMKCTSRQRMNKSGMLVCPTFVCTEVKMTDIQVDSNMNWCSDF